MGHEKKAESTDYKVDHKADPTAWTGPEEELDLLGNLAIRLQARNRHLAIEQARYWVDEVFRVLSDLRQGARAVPAVDRNTEGQRDEQLLD